MRGFAILYLFTISFLALSSPLIEIASPKAKEHLSFLKESFPNAKLNVVVHTKYRSPRIWVNGKSLPYFKDEGKLKNTLKKKIEEALQQEQSAEITVYSLTISKKEEEFFFSFVPCNYSKRDFRGRWVAFVTEENGYLLHRTEGKLEVPSRACGRPISFGWRGKYKSPKPLLIVAFFDGKGKFLISKSNREMEVREK